MAKNVFKDGRPVEIERKYLIKIPDLEVLKNQPNYNSSAIEQMYIADNGEYKGGRIRKREYASGCKYYKTYKENINGLSKFEVESEITAEEYNILSERRLENTRAIIKVRHCFDYQGQTFELDIYEFWNDKATLEVELESEEQKVVLPEFIEIIADVTGNKAYSNYSLALC